MCTMAACSVSGFKDERNEQGMLTTWREEEYMEAIRGWEPDTIRWIAKVWGLAMQTIMEHPYIDVLGAAFMEIYPSRSRNGEFYTPVSITRMMAEMVYAPDLKEFDWPITIMEPACGGGQMILSLAQAMAGMDIPHNAMVVTAQDTSRIAADMCYVNMSLHGIPGWVLHGNSITNEVYGTWRTPWIELGPEAKEVYAGGDPVRVPARQAVDGVAHDPTGSGGHKERTGRSSIESGTDKPGRDRGEGHKDTLLSDKPRAKRRDAPIGPEDGADLTLF